MMGQKLIIAMENKNINVTIVDPVFFWQRKCEVKCLITTHPSNKIKYTQI